MYTGSYWHTAAPFAAAIANIKKLHAHPDAPGHMRQIGEGIMEGMEKVGANHGFHLKATGEPSLFYLRIADDDSFKLHQEFIAECVKRGSLLASHHNHFTNLAETQEDVDKTIEIADEALSVVASVTRDGLHRIKRLAHKAKEPRFWRGFFYVQQLC